MCFVKKQGQSYDRDDNSAMNSSVLCPRIKCPDTFTYIPQLLNRGNLILCQHMYCRHVTFPALIMYLTCTARSDAAHEPKCTDRTQIGHITASSNISK